MHIHSTTQENSPLISFFQPLQKPYQKPIPNQHLLHTYKPFNQILPSKPQQNTHCAPFQKQTRYSPYP
ncbi:UPF0223 family protein, partial [Bacillus pumilus]|uniref:UPF0223 family protein n=1 Tax=Bacillus pumilus TaxID=1408 RepID=UPI0021B3855A